MNQNSSKKSNFLSKAVSLLFITSYFSFAILPQIGLGQPTEPPTPSSGDTIQQNNTEQPTPSSQEGTTPTNQNTPDTTTPTNQNTPDTTTPTNQNTPDTT
ncbi:MAG: hypothetical protein V7L20_25560, partial [Nostoc sp.]